MVDFGERLRQLRISKYLSQEQLAKKICVTKSMISAYENSVRLPSHDVFIKIALFFKVSTDYLYGINERQFLDTTGLSEHQIAMLSNLVDELKAKK